jgi:hypothetical protein
MSKIAISAEAMIFFTKHGHLELEIEHDEVKGCGRDLWRENEKLKNFLVKKLSAVIFPLTGKKQLLLGCDQFFKKEELPKTALPLKELLSVQGLALGVAISENPHPLPRRQELGIVPVPSDKKHILFFKPGIILDFPHANSDVYIAVYVLPSAVYVHNAKDPYTHALKKFGYQFGDVLKHHPLITQ